MTQPDNQRRELREKLAAIEHERWASWQKWLHSQLKKTPDGMLMTPDYYYHLEEQIAADYSELSEQEKDSDREQVDRYLPLLDTHIAAQVREARIDELQITKSSIRKGQGLLGGHAVMRCEEMRQWLNKRIEDLQRLAAKEKP